jgi:hypothetical protein
VTTPDGVINLDHVAWHLDHAGGRRYRAWLGRGWELIAYEKGGDWEVRGPPLGKALASGLEPTLEAAQSRCIKVAKALMEPVVGR